MLTLNTNSPASTAANTLSEQNEAMATTFAQLSTGLTGVDAVTSGTAPQAIGESLTNEAAKYGQAGANAEAGAAFINVISSAVDSALGLVKQMSLLAMQAASSNINESDTANAGITSQYQQLTTELNRVNNSTTFNGVRTFKVPGASGETLKFQIGIGATESNNTVSFSTFGIDAATLSVSGLTMSDNATATTALTDFDKAIDKLTSRSITLGSAAAQLANAQSLDATSKINLEKAASSLLDTDYAAATSTLAKQKVLTQSASAMLTQANQQPQQVLSLLRQ
jgi:flagellin